MRKILKITSMLGVVTVLKILAGVVRTKFLAWQIGPAGMGLVSQAMMYSMFTIQLCSLSVATGITKNISESLATGDGRKASLTVNMSVTMQFIVSILFIVLVLPFSGPLTKFIFSDARYYPYFIGLTLVTPFALFMVGVVDPVFYGFKKIPEYTRLMIWYTVIGLLLVFPAVYIFKTEGMLAQIIIISLIGFAISYYFITKKTALSPRIDFGILRGAESRDMMRHLLKYGLTLFVMGGATILTTLYLRSILIKKFGIDANGYYQVAYAISASYLPFITNAIWGYFYPSMCALQNKEEINRELNQFIRFALFASTGIAALCIIFRYYVILMLYSREFMDAYNLLAIQAVGDIFFILFCIFSTSLLARKKLKPVIFISTIAYNMVLIFLYMLFSGVPQFGFQSLNMAMAATNLILVVVLMVYSKIDTGFTPSGKNIALFIRSAILIAAIYFLPNKSFLSVILKMALVPVWLILSVTKQEAKSFADIALSSFRGKDPASQGG